MEFKICTKCGKTLPATNEYFGLRKADEHGLRSNCKECMMHYQSNYYEANIEHTKERVKKYNEVNKEKRKEYYNKNKEHHSEICKKYRELNKDKIDKVNKIYNGNNKEKMAEYGKQYREENKEIIAAKSKIYREINKERFAEKQKQWRIANKDKCNIKTERHNSRKRSLLHTLTVPQWEIIKQHFKNKCAYCGEELPLSQEHFVALSKGGEFTHNNIIPSCKSCNSSKKDNNFFEWYPKYEHYSKKREKAILEYLGYKNENVQQLRLG